MKKSLNDVTQSGAANRRAANFINRIYAIRSAFMTLAWRLTMAARHIWKTPPGQTKQSRRAPALPSMATILANVGIVERDAMRGVPFGAPRIRLFFNLPNDGIHRAHQRAYEISFTGAKSLRIRNKLERYFWSLGFVHTTSACVDQEIEGATAKVIRVNVAA
jgi:hypothetical protein